MRYRIAKHRLKLKKILFSKKVVILICAAVIILSIHMYNKIVTENIQEPVINETITRTNDIINTSVNEFLNTNSNFFNSCFIPQNASDGSVSSYGVNTEIINNAEKEIVSKLRKKLVDNDLIIIDIPIGTLIGNQYFSGKGFPVRVKVYSSSQISSEIETKIESVGINHTLYKVMLKLNIEAELIFPKGNETVTMTNSVNLAEKIILGGVPLA